MKSTKAPVEADRLVGLRLKALRQERGISQTALGQAIGVTFQQVQKYENGVNRIAGTRMQRAAELLGVPVGYFYGDETSEDSVRLVALFDSITDQRKRQAILTFVETMVT